MKPDGPHEQTIAASTHWNGTHHEVEYPCAFCGYAWPTADNLRKHIATEHPDRTGARMTTYKHHFHRVRWMPLLVYWKLELREPPLGVIAEGRAFTKERAWKDSIEAVRQHDSHSRPNPRTLLETRA